LTTVAGALVLAARSRYEGRFDSDRNDPMVQHEQLLHALQRSARPSEPPATMVVLDSGPQGGPAGG
jgi:hypothetical protein